MKQIGLFKNENVPVPLLPQEHDVTVPFSPTFNTTLIYGWMLRSDYISAGTVAYFDVNFGSIPSGTAIVPRMSGRYNGGAYTDVSFTDRSIKADLSTIEYDGYTWYYYYFANGIGYYLLDRSNAGYNDANAYYTTYMRFIIEPLS